MIFVFLLGILVYYNIRESSKTEASSELKNASSKETSEKIKVDNKVTEETKKVNEKEATQEKIAKTYEINPTKTEEEKEKIKQPPSQEKLLITTLGTKIRKGPGKRYSVVSVVKKGETVEWLDEEHRGWIKIKTQDGREGWIRKELVREIAK